MHGTQSSRGVSRSACCGGGLGGQLGPHALELLTRVFAARALVQLHLRDESAGDAGDRLAALLAAAQGQNSQGLAGAGDAHVHQPALLLQTLGVMSSSSDLEGQQALVDACQDDVRPLQALGRVEGGERDLVLLVAALGDAEDDADGLGHLQHGLLLSGLRPQAGRRSVWRSSRRSRSHCSSARRRPSRSLRCPSGAARSRCRAAIPSKSARAASWPSACRARYSRSFT